MERVAAVGQPSEIEFREGDVVLLTVKTQDTRAALTDLVAATDLDLPIVCAQNGVASERMVARCYSRVYGMLIWLPSIFLDPGRVISYGHPGIAMLDAGCYPSGVDACIEEVTAAIRNSGMHATPRRNIMAWKYNKLRQNMNNAFDAMLDLGADASHFVDEARREATACIEAAGIELVPQDEATATRAQFGVHPKPVDGVTLGGSSWQSLQRGLGSIETDYINGEIVQLGRAHGVATPVNLAIVRLANRFAQSKRKPGELSVEDFEAELARVRTASP